MPVMRPGSSSPPHPVIWLLAGLIFACEALPWAAERGLLPGWPGRQEFYGLLAFYSPSHAWNTLMGHERLLWGYLSYAFVHAGWLHLAMNLAAFIGLGHAITRGAGPMAFVAIFVVTTVGGALAFSAISTHPGPLVGASGAVFGFLAVLTCWQERALAARGLSRDVIWRRIAGLAVINGFFGLVAGGMLAWEAHLGGFVAGWVMGLVYPPRRTVLSLIS